MARFELYKHLEQLALKSHLLSDLDILLFSILKYGTHQTELYSLVGAIFLIPIYVIFSSYLR
jgi:hypothetical protein